MASQPDSSSSEGRVVKFNPRPAVPAPSPIRSPAAPSTIDYRQRMWANLAATAFAAVLIAVGVWLVTSLHHMSETQDCVMMGLRNCGQIDAPPHS